MGQVEAAGPSAFWQLNDSQLPTAFDSSGNGNNGEFSSGVTASMLDQPGFGSGSLALNGDTSAYVQLPGSLLATAGPFTVQAWFRTSSPSGIILGAENSLSDMTSYAPMLYVDANGDLEAAMWWDGAADTLTSTSLVDDGAWHEVVLSITASGTETLTVDGVQQATRTLGPDENGPEPYATIGAGNGTSWPNLTGSTGFDGQIADVAFYNTVLSAATIQAQFDAAGLVPSSTPAITGTPVVGDTLVASNPTWTGSGPITYSDQWEDCSTAAQTACSAISGATSSTYTVQSSDVGSYLAYKVTATNSLGSASVSSLAALVGSASSYVGEVQAAAPAAFWQLNDAALPTAFDASGNGNNGTFSSGVTSGMLDQPGFSANSGSLALTTDSSAYVQVPIGLLPTSAMAFSIEAWFRTSTPQGVIFGGDDNLGNDDDGGSIPMLYIDASGDLEATAWDDGTTNMLVSSSPVDDGNWHEAVLTITAAGAETLYLDGTQEATGTLGAIPSWATTTYATIGAGSTQYWPGGVNGWVGFDGNIADVSVYDSTLAQSTVDAQYNAAVQTVPLNTALPAITGTLQPGQTLTATPGTWSGNVPITDTYQWQDCTTPAETSCTDIAGATSSTYTVQSSDVGSDVAVDVTATNALGSASASSPAGLVAAASSYAGLVQAADPVAFWPLDDSSLPTAADVSGNGNNATYASGITSSMLDQPGIGGGGSVALDGNPAAYVLFPGSVLPGSSTADTVQMWFRTSSPSGVLMGSEYSLGPSQPTAWDPMIYVDSAGDLETELWWDGSYNTIVSTSPVDDGQWHQVVVTVSSAGAETLFVDGAQQGTGTLSASPAAGYATIGAGSSQGFPAGVDGWNTINGQIADVAIYKTALSQATIQAQYAAGATPTNTVAPAITGTDEVGDTLVASSGTWTGSGSIAYTYQWEDCDSAGASCTAITGATSSAYTLTDADVGDSIVVDVTASYAGATGGATAQSAATMVVQALAPENTALPTIVGIAGVGDTLTADPGSWTGTPPIVYSYQWQDCDSSGGSCTDISGATADTYTVASSDSGDTIVVVVTASNSSLPGGAAVAGASGPTAVVAAASSTTSYDYDSDGRLTGASTSSGGG